MAFLTRYSSAAALAATLVSPIIAYALGDSNAAIVFARLAALVWVKHSGNIERLIGGTESRIGSKG